MWLAAGIIGVMALLAWLWLLLFRGGFWRMSLRLSTQKNREIVVSNPPDTWPGVCAIVPARNEADMLPQTLPALLEQSYDGPFSVILVDDHSEDGTATIARNIAQASSHPERLTIISADALPPGFVGKVWAQQCGLRHAPHDAEFILFTDADILHPAHSVESLVRKALSHPSSDLVSLMVRLRIESFWETLLIPAFVYFFAKLYPFRWVGSPHRQTAAAAGGSILVRHKLVRQDDGLAPIGGALIDDCSLAQLIQSRNGSLWLGLGDDVISLRAYPKLADIWNMVARSAFVQLHYSTWLLIGTVVGMLVLYACPVVFGIASVCLLGTSIHVVGWSIAAATNLCAWLLMSISFVPMLRWYKVDLWKAALLPLDGFLYTLMTIDSARRFWQGHTDAWKGRPYQRSEPAGWKSR